MSRTFEETIYDATDKKKLLRQIEKAEHTLGKVSVIGRPEGFVHDSQLHERRTILWFPPGANQKYVTEWRGRGVVNKDFTIKRHIVKAALPQESPKSENIACKRKTWYNRHHRSHMLCSGQWHEDIGDRKMTRGFRFKNVPGGEVAVYDSERMQICDDTIDDIDHPSFDVLDHLPWVVRV